MRRCVYLTMDDLGDYVSDADLSIPAMESAGWQIEKVSWRATDFDWSSADLVYVCTPWDYHEHLPAFLAAIERIEAADTVLANTADTIRWNADKRYLKALSGRGHAIVPSHWHDSFSDNCIEEAFEAFATDKAVIKPCVGACAMDTFVLRKGEMPDADLASLYRDRPFFIQPFVDSVQTTGEYSLFFFDGQYSHAIIKVPKEGDFRVQEEFGSDIVSIEASDAMVAQAHAVVDQMEPATAYARVDYVTAPDGSFWIMELELIEPSLYFRTDPLSTERFAAAMTRYYERQVA